MDRDRRASIRATSVPISRSGVSRPGSAPRVRDRAAATRRVRAPALSHRKCTIVQRRDDGRRANGRDLFQVRSAVSEAAHHMPLPLTHSMSLSLTGAGPIAVAPADGPSGIPPQVSGRSPASPVHGPLRHPRPSACPSPGSGCPVHDPGRASRVRTLTILHAYRLLVPTPAVHPGDRAGGGAGDPLQRPSPYLLAEVPRDEDRIFATSGRGQPEAPNFRDPCASATEA